MAKTSLKTKTAAVAAAQSREEVERLVARIGVLSRGLKRCEADLGDSVAKAKEEHEAIAGPLKDEIAQAQQRVHLWCEANREELTGGGRSKTVQLTTGEVKWRLRPPKVNIRGADAVLEFLREQMQGRFIRRKEEIDREALLAEPQTAETIPGVSIGSAGEDFVIEPFEAELAEAA